MIVRLAKSTQTSQHVFFGKLPAQSVQEATATDADVAQIRKELWGRDARVHNKISKVLSTSTRYYIGFRKHALIIVCFSGGSMQR